MNRHMPQNDALRDRLDAIHDEARQFCIADEPEAPALWVEVVGTLAVMSVIVGLLVWLPIKLFGGIVP